VRRRQVVARGKRDYLWVTAPLFLVETVNTQDENTMVTASDWRAGTAFERATLLRVIIEGHIMPRFAAAADTQSVGNLAVAIGNGTVTVPDISLLTTYNDFDLVAPWTGLARQEVSAANNTTNTCMTPPIKIDLSVRRRISVEDNVTLVTRTSSTLDMSGGDLVWTLVTKCLLQRE